MRSAAQWRSRRRAGIQLRTLNASKGPAVRATRAQADRHSTSARSAGARTQPNLQFPAGGRRPRAGGRRVVGCVTLSGIEFRARTLVLTVGTFLGGKIHVGLQSHAGGRAGDPASNRLAARLRELPLSVGRLKTGTPPRIDGRSIDYRDLREQHSDEPRPVSRPNTRAAHPPQIPCHITATNERTHAHIRGAATRSPMFTGLIEGTGPAIVRRSRTRSCASPTGPRIRSSSSPKACPRTRSIRMGSRPASRSTFSSISCAPSKDSSTPTSPGPDTPSSTTSSTRAVSRQAWRTSSSEACISPARSTVRRAMKRRPPRASWRASMRRSPRADARRGRRKGARRISAFSWTISSPAARPSPTGCSRAAPSIDFVCARTMRIYA